jgi:hypothetical protein
MMRKIFCSILLFVFSNHSLVAQYIEDKNYSKSLVFVEAGGFGGYGSLNYEHLLKKINKVKVSVRVGLSTYNLMDFSHKFNPDIIVPIAVNGYYGSTHHVDFSLGKTITHIVYTDKSNYQPARSHSFNSNLSVGYRYQKEEGGLLFKIAYTPMLENNQMFRNWGALAMGYAF